MSELTILPQQPPEFIKLLAHDLRWSLLKALTVGDHRVQELVDFVREPMNLVSYHLKRLRAEGLVYTRRSEADGRDIYYSLDLDKLRDLYWAAGASLHSALGKGITSETTISKDAQPYILFVCTHNSARSQMAEGLMRHMAGDYVQVHSAGSHPTRLHPDAVRVMDVMGMDIRGQESKHLREFEGQPFDYVITVCDLAREVCPTFPGQGQQLHWGFPDPTKILDAKERLHTFEQTAHRLKSRIEYFLQGIFTPKLEESE